VAKFVRGRPVETDAPTVEVDGGLPPGRHRFELVVEDEAGNRSDPSTVDVVVGEGRGPRRLFGRLFGRRPE
jgi:hypothetical protein